MSHDQLPLSLSVVKQIRDLTDHKDAWTRLLGKQPDIAPTISFAWIISYLTFRVKPGQSWFCILAYHNSDLVGAMPLIVTKRPFPFRNSPTFNSPFDHHTYATDILADPTHAKLVIDAMIEKALSLGGPFSVIKFARVPENSSSLACLRKYLSDQSIIRDVSLGAFLPLSSDFEQYRRHLSRNFRSNLNKAHSKLRQYSDHTFRIMTDTIDVNKTLELFMTIEASSWKGREGSALLCSRSLIRFYSLLCATLNEAHSLEWHFLEVNGTPIAGNLAIRSGNKLLIWKLAYDPEFSKCSPGSLLLEYVIRHYSSTASSITEIDFLTDFPWYSNWQVKKRIFYRITVFPPGILSKAFFHFPLYVYDRLRILIRAVRFMARE